MCKHIAAVLYGIGARLDHKPELLFKLRGVDHEELIATDAEAAVSVATAGGKSKRLAAGDLSDVFGIELDTASSEQPTQTASSEKTKRARQKPTERQAVKKRAVTTKTTARKAKKKLNKAKKKPNKAKKKLPQRPARQIPTATQQ
jgi:uncharacterized Zn finger protein